ncbi:MAG TPA: hypothetical protein VLL52_01510 [Anaerolineae bacterium]|nr:hypothetical protein [Anaerolineae bacterium]
MKLIKIMMMMLLVVGLVACGGGETEPAATDEGVMEGEMDHGSMEMEEEETVPNEGAVIEIVSPAEGETFTVDDQIKVEVETNYAIGEEGKHWHIYLDGSSWGMIMGNNKNSVLRGLEPGEHEIMVKLANGEHINLEEGDMVKIMVTE